MNHSIQKLAQSQLEIKFEVPAEEFQNFIEKAVLKLGESVEVEGFRRGKAPKEMVEKAVGQGKILQEASQECVKESYLKVVRERELEPLGQPEISVLKLAAGNPLEFKARIAILPEVVLADYKSIVSKLKKPEIKVTDEEIEKLRREKERAAQESLRQEILDKIAAQSRMEIPEVLIDSEKSRLLASVKEQVPQMLGISYEDYLKKINKTEREISDSFRSEAEKRVRNSLVLREVQKKEKIEVSEKEIQDEMAKIAKADAGLAQSQLRDYTESVIKNEKTFKFLEGLIR